MSVATALPGPPTPTRRSQRYQLDTPGPADDPAIAGLLRLPMGERVRLSLRREPDRRLASRVQGDRHHEIVVRQRVDGQVVGYAHRAVRMLWIDGQAQRVGYLGGLRVRPGVRLPRGVIGEAFDAMLATRQPDEAGFDLTSILSDNRAARRGLERNLPGLPTYTPWGEMLTVTFRVRGAPSRGAVTPSPAAQGRLHRCHDPLYHARPCWPGPRDARLALGQQAVAIGRAADPLASAVVWDQRALKQVVVDALHPALRRCRWVLNAGFAVAGRPALPPPGRALALGYVSHIACGPDPDRLWQLLRAAEGPAAGMGLKLLSVGLADTREHRAVARRLRGWVSRSVIYRVHRGPAVQVSERPVWPEVALL